MTKELPKAYDFKSTEPRIYAMWEAGKYFKPHNDPNNPDFDPNVKPFVISIPPPNVTGELHLGHAMFVSVEDLMIRYHRMKGYSTLWVPGTDHAGIATQLMVERDLLRTFLRESSLVELYISQPEALIVARWPEPRTSEGWEVEKTAKGGIQAK